MGDRCGMSISADSPLDETLNRGPLALLFRRQYEFPFWINIVQFSFSFFIFRVNELTMLNEKLKIQLEERDKSISTLNKNVSSLEQRVGAYEMPETDTAREVCLF